MLSITNNVELYSDGTVIQKILAGDLNYFEVLIRRYNSVLYKIARSYGFNHHDAEDLMQDTHVAGYLSLGQFAGRSSYKTWISKIMVNKCLYKLKYGYYKRELLTESVPGSNEDYMPLKIKDTQSEDTVINRELTMILEKSLQNIPQIYRTVFVCRELEGFSIAETAELLNISPMNVKVRLNRAKALLQQRIQDFYSKSEVYSFNLIYCDAIVERVFDKIKKLEPGK